MNDLECLWAADSGGEGGGSSGKPYDIEIVLTEELDSVVDIKHGDASLTFEEFKTAIMTRNTNIYSDLEGVYLIKFHPQVSVEDDSIELVSFTESDNDLLAALYMVLYPVYSDSVVKFIDIENTDSKPVQEIEAPDAILVKNYEEYYLTNVSDLEISYPSDRQYFECHMFLSTAASGTVTISFPSSSYIGDIPEFGNGETWEISIKDAVIIAGKVITGA